MLTTRTQVSFLGLLHSSHALLHLVVVKYSTLFKLFTHLLEFRQRLWQLCICKVGCCRLSSLMLHGAGASQTGLLLLLILESLVYFLGS